MKETTSLSLHPSINSSNVGPHAIVMRERNRKNAAAGSFLRADNLVGEINKYRDNCRTREKDICDIKKNK